MHKMQAFKTCDGQLFEDEATAALHEAKLKIGEWADRKGIDEKGTLTCEKVARAMIDDAEELAHLFVNLVRSLPKCGEHAFMGGYIDEPGGENTLWQVNGESGERVTS
jgi:hypothetical protein